MRRIAAKVDANQAEIVKALRKAFGFHVMTMHTLGDGKPDILVTGHSRRLGYTAALLVEVKAGNGKLTEKEKEFHSEYPADGPLIVANSVEDIVFWFHGE